MENKPQIDAAAFYDHMDERTADHLLAAAQGATDGLLIITYGNEAVIFQTVPAPVCPSVLQLPPHGPVATETT